MSNFLQRAQSEGATGARTTPLPLPTSLSRDGSSYRSLKSLNESHTDGSFLQARGLCQVFLNAVEPSFEQPWTKLPPEQSMGSAFVFDLVNRLVMTNAHCVTHARTILLRKEGDFDKFEGRVLAISHQADIAILTVDDEAFWLDAQLIDFGQMPHMQQEVDVVGYPTGGTTICISSGVVSRIDFTGYSQSGGEKNLCVQIDAAINPGNSGGPALSDGQLIGVAFQGMSSSQAELVGYIIPVPVVLRCLEDFAACVARDERVELAAPIRPLIDGRGAEGGGQRSAAKGGLAPQADEGFGGKRTIWPASSSPGEPLIALQGFSRFSFVKWQETECKYLRKSVRLPDSESGVLVTSVSKVSALVDKIKKNDVIVAVDGQKVSNNGKVSIPPLPPMNFESIVAMKLVGEPLTLSVYRNGTPLTLSIAAENPPRLCPLVNYGTATSFVQWAGLTFAPFCQNAVDYGGFIAKDGGNALKVQGREFSDPEHQMVVLVAMLPHRVSIGYNLDSITQVTGGTMSPLFKVNGKEVFNLLDVAIAVEETEEEWLSFEFCNDITIVLPLKEGKEATSDLQKDFNMAAPFSDDILEALKKRKSREGEASK